MAKNAVVSEELANKFKTEKETAYTRWVRGEGLDIIGAHYVQNLKPSSSSHGRGAAARRLPQSRGLAHLERLLCDGNPAGQSWRRTGSSTRR